eukprot:359660-Chlamydomonas_euryale.AAC.16
MVARAPQSQNMAQNKQPNAPSARSRHRRCRHQAQGCKLIGSSECKHMSPTLACAWARRKRKRERARSGSVEVKANAARLSSWPCCAVLRRAALQRDLTSARTRRQRTATRPVESLRSVQPSRWLLWRLRPQGVARRER